MVRFENVGLRYGMGAEILRDINFRSRRSSFQFLTGPSGAGKTTLLRLMLLSLRADARHRSTYSVEDAAKLDKDCNHRVAAADWRRVPGFSAARSSDDL